MIVKGRPRSRRRPRSGAGERSAPVFDQFHPTSTSPGYTLHGASRRAASRSATVLVVRSDVPCSRAHHPSRRAHRARGVDPLSPLSIRGFSTDLALAGTRGLPSRPRGGGGRRATRGGEERRSAGRRARSSVRRAKRARAVQIDTHGTWPGVAAACDSGTTRHRGHEYDSMRPRPAYATGSYSPRVVGRVLGPRSRPGAKAGPGQTSSAAWATARIIFGAPPRPLRARLQLPRSSSSSTIAPERGQARRPVPRAGAGR